MQNSRFRFSNRAVYTALIVLCIIGFWLFENRYTPTTYSPNEVTMPGKGVPEFVEPSSTTGSVIKHQYFWLSYREEYEQAEWVSYTLQRMHLTQDGRKRPYFIEDPYIRTKSADWRNYRGSGYDRGHLCPAGDRRFTEYAYNETFYTSNIAPQYKDFNAGVWNRLENQVRYWSREYGTIYVVTGGVLEKGLQGIGDENVAIPGAYYKIIARGNRENLKVLAFLMPHRESDFPLEHFLVPVDEVERLTGIDFFERLPSGLAGELESSIHRQDWDF